MSKVEILFYSPLDLDEFKKFCFKGKEASPGVPAKDEDGRKMVGVFSWLKGWGVKEAHFFHTPADHPMKFFIALVKKRDGDNEVRPWFRRVATTPPKIALLPDIPGVDKVLRIDGELGMLDGFSPIGELLGAVTSDPDLDAKFAALSQRVQDVLQRLEEDPAGTERFLAALRGDKESDPVGVFKELSFSLN